MSTTRQHPPGDLGPEPDGIASASASDASASGSAVPQTPVARAPGGAAPGPGEPAAKAAQAAAAEGAAVPGAAPLQVRSLPLNGASGIVPLARDFTRQALYDWGWLPASTGARRAAAEDVLLVVSELVTNACLHAEGPDGLRIACDGKVLRLEVTDRSVGEPTPRDPHQAGRPGGHGMFIVQRLCLDWGVAKVTDDDGKSTGKTVWAELAAPA
ncbi:ATP-binding protein [Streptomyces sp. NPDC058657]|uniref:ATP-binding protein n=1 Tax=unclassified Streptomyces TaxID=2593676 RepID=UPI00365BB45C